MGINLIVLSQIERVIKCFPKIFKFNTRTTVILNGLDCREFSLLDLIHELLWTILLVGNFINFSIKKVIFHPPNHLFEFLLVFQSFWLSVHIEIPLIIIIPPGFGVLHNVDFLRMFIPYVIDIDSKWVDNFFKCIVIKNEICFKVLDKICQIFNKVIFFLTILDERLFCCMNIFLNYWYINSNRGIIWCKSLV